MRSRTLAEAANGGIPAQVCAAPAVNNSFWCCSSVYILFIALGRPSSPAWRQRQRHVAWLRQAQLDWPRPGPGACCATGGPVHIRGKFDCTSGWLGLAHLILMSWAVANHTGYHSRMRKSLTSSKEAGGTNLSAHKQAKISRHSSKAITLDENMKLQALACMRMHIVTGLAITKI